MAAVLTAREKRWLDYSSWANRKVSLSARLQYLDDDGQYTGSLSASIAILADASDIAEDDIVYVSGYDETSGKAKVTPADADDGATAQDLYYAPSAISAGAAGFVMIRGQFVSTLNGTIGDPVYLSDGTAGAVTLTPPTGTDVIKQIGSLASTGASGVVHVEIGGEAVLIHTHQDNARGGQIPTAGIANDAVDKDKIAADVAGTGLEQHTTGAIRIAAAAAGNGLAGGAGTALSLDLNELTGAVADVTADSIPFLDATDSGSKVESIDDLVTALAGDGLQNTSSQFAFDASDIAGLGMVATGENLDVSLNGFAAGAVDVTADSVVIIDANDSSLPKKESIDDLMTAQAGDGIQVTASQFAFDASDINGLGLIATGENLDLSLTALAAAAIDVTADSIAIIDANDSSLPKKELWSDVATAIAGTGLIATSGVLSVSQTELADTVFDVSADSLAFIDATDTYTKKDLWSDIVASTAGVGISATAGVMALDVNELTAAAVDVANDSIAILDATDSSTKKESLADYATAIAGDGLAATNGVLAVDQNELTGAVVDVAADSFPFIDATDSSTKKEAFADLATAFAGDGLAAASGVLALDLNELTAAAVDVTADSIAIIDATDNGSKKESIDDLVTALAGDGIQNLLSVFAVDVSDFAGKGVKDDGSENIALDINGLDAAAVDMANDSIAILDAGDAESKKESIADFASGLAGDGLAATTGVLALDLNELTGAVMDVAADSIAFIDATDSSTKKEAAADFVGLIAGNGLTATSGVLAATTTVEENTAGTGAPNVLLATEDGKVLSNEGSAATNYHTLPTAAAGLGFVFINADATDLIRVTAASSDKIMVAGSLSVAAGYIESTARGDSVMLIAVDEEIWFATSVVGTWNVETS